MNRQRRSLLKAAGLVPAASTGLVHAARQSAVPPLPGESLLLQHFACLEGESFEFSMNGARASAVLQSAVPLEGAADGDQNFRLVFAPLRFSTITQGTWEVTHPALGTHAIFLSPNDALAQDVEAVFNRQA
ncbi:DUF6916 family protein [Diaphorobacter nitroreducens]|uniref:DUF6916 family protein n=1 Tax=Diaphorobacter nitroreducens TaxID=164759 RepID=UPI0035E3D00F